MTFIFFFFFFSEKTSLDISCESSAKQTIHMKCQGFFSLKKMSSAAVVIGALRVKTIIKCGIWQPVKFQLVSRFWTRLKMKCFFFVFFLSYLWINVANINSEIRLKIISFQERRDELKFYRLSGARFMFLLIPYINSSNSSFFFFFFFWDNKLSNFEEYEAFQLLIRDRNLAFNLDSAQNYTFVFSPLEAVLLLKIHSFYCLLTYSYF